MRSETTDITIIGSGIAGLYCALKCADFAQVTLITKGEIGESNTRYAQGGIAAVMDAHDSVEQHVQDTLAAGDGLCDEPAVRLMAEQAKSAVFDLQRMHAVFDKTRSGEFDLHREGGHSRARVVHRADATGREIEGALVGMVRMNSNITVREHGFAMDLICDRHTCCGVTVYDKVEDEVIALSARALVLATGGAAQIYKYNTNPMIATGDGFAMAKRAGARINNMEFVQFHPTTLYSPGSETFLITEALRGHGAQLRNGEGEDFMPKYHPMGSLAPRDVVSRAIILELQRSSELCVFLDARSIDPGTLSEHFPNILRRCMQEGIDVQTDMIPVIPAAHYTCGGVVTDLRARTSIDHLYACGEVACTRVHGANRLASNSLLEGLVFAVQAAEHIKVSSYNTRSQFALSDRSTQFAGRGKTMQIQRKSLQELMWEYVGIIRTEAGLRQCLSELNAMKLSDEAQAFTIEELEFLNMIETGIMIVEAALRRKKSAGCHYRVD